MITKRDETPPWPERSAAAGEARTEEGSAKPAETSVRYKVAKGKTIVSARGPLNAGEEVTARDFDPDEEKGLEQLKKFADGEYLVVADDPKTTEEKPKSD